MAVFDSLDHTTDKAIDSGEDFIRTSEAYYELKLFQMLSASLSMLVKFTVISGFTFIAIILFAVAAAIGVGQLLNNLILGFVLVALSFVCIAAFIYSIRRRVESKVIKYLSLIIFK